MQFYQLIVDGFHIDEDVIRATYKAIGKERIILITDANPCKGLPDGQYHFSGKDIVIVGDMLQSKKLVELQEAH